MSFENPAPIPDNLADQLTNQEQENKQELGRFLQEDGWEPTDGMFVGDTGKEDINNPGDRAKMRRLSDSDPNQPMTYNRNGNVLAVVNERGTVFAAPYTKEREDKLRSLGLGKDEGLGVPLSHGETPAHPGQRERWEQATNLAAHQEQLRMEEEKKKAA